MASPAEVGKLPPAPVFLKTCCDGTHTYGWILSSPSATVRLAAEQWTTQRQLLSLFLVHRISTIWFRSQIHACQLLFRTTKITTAPPYKHIAAPSHAPKKTPTGPQGPRPAARGRHRRQVHLARLRRIHLDTRLLGRLVSVPPRLFGTSISSGSSGSRSGGGGNGTSFSGCYRGAWRGLGLGPRGASRRRRLPRGVPV